MSEFIFAIKFQSDLICFFYSFFCLCACMHTHITHNLWPVIICLQTHSQTNTGKTQIVFPVHTAWPKSYICSESLACWGNVPELYRQGDVDTLFSPAVKSPVGFSPEGKPTKAWGNITFMLNSALQYVQFILCTGSSRTLNKGKKAMAFCGMISLTLLMVPLYIWKAAAGVCFIDTSLEVSTAQTEQSVLLQYQKPFACVSVYDVGGDSYSLLVTIAHLQVAHQGSKEDFSSSLACWHKTLSGCVVLPCWTVLLSWPSFPHSWRYGRSPGRTIFVRTRTMTLQEATWALMGQWVAAEPSLWGTELAITARSTRSRQWSVPI